jgi:ABC-2 type transport system permease protein
VGLFGLRWAGTGAFLRTELRVQLHEGLAIVTSMIVQAVLLIFVLVLDPALLAYALVGAVVYSVFMLGQRVQNEAAYIRIDHKLTELYHASPLSAEGYFVGMSIGVLLAYLPPIVLLAIALEAVVGLTALAAGVLLLASFALWMFTCSFGYFVSTLFKDNRAIWPYASLITNAFGVLPPVFYPLAFLPGYWHPIALVLPTSAAVSLVEAAQGGLIALTPGEVLLAASALVVEALGAFALAVLWARRTAREA